MCWLQVSKEEYGRLGQEALGRRLVAQLEAEGKKPFLIPVGGDWMRLCIWLCASGSPLFCCGVESCHSSCRGPSLIALGMGVVRCYPRGAAGGTSRP